MFFLASRTITNILLAFISTAMTLIVFAIFETAKQAKAILMIFYVTQQGQNKLVRGELIVALED